MKLYIVRHGTTEWNVQYRFQGRTDIELNSNGRILAGKLGEKLENVHFDCIYSSPLSRAYETANLIRGHRNIQIIKDDLLTEISFGELEGSFSDDFLNTDTPRKYFFTEPQKYVAFSEIVCENFSFFVVKREHPAFSFTKRENTDFKGGRKMEELKKWVISVLLYLF